MHDRKILSRIGLERNKTKLAAAFDPKVDLTKMKKRRIYDVWKKENVGKDV